jgi:hypothetical protein
VSHRSRSYASPTFPVSFCSGAWSASCSLAADSAKLFDLETEINHAYRTVFRERGNSDSWPDVAEGFLSKIDEVNGLLRLREGVYRLSGKIPVNERPIPARVVNELKAYADTRRAAE